MSVISNFCSCTPDLFVRRTCYFCDVKTKYWNWSETLDIVAPVGLLLAVAVAKKTNIVLNANRNFY